MAKVRSPSYPAIGLKEAVEKAQAVYNNDYQNPVSREVAAKHMGYAGLNGKSLGVLAALGKYGLLEGRGDSTRVSDLALRIIAHQPGDPARTEAVKEAASRPELFADLDKRYPDGKGSDAAIRSYLLTQKFIPHAADNALRSYRETKAMSVAECEDLQLSNVSTQPKTDESAVDQSQIDQIDWSTVRIVPSDPPQGDRRAVFDLTEGEVVITYPNNLSPESVSDLQDYLNVFMKKAKRESGTQ